MANVISRSAWIKRRETPGWIRTVRAERRARNKELAAILRGESGPNYGTNYTERDQILEAMGFADYRSYLKGPLWESIRSRIMTPGQTCKVCDAPATEVHHTDYHVKTLRGSDLSGMVCLCRNCHHSAEFDEKGRKRSLARANAWLFGPGWEPARSIKPKAAKPQEKPTPRRTRTDAMNAEAARARSKKVEERNAKILANNARRKRDAGLSVYSR